MSAVSSYAGDGVLTSGGDSRPIEGFRRLYDPEGYFMHLDMQRRIVRSVVIIVGIAGVAGAGLIAQSARGVGRDFTQADPRGQFFRMPDLGGGRLASPSEMSRPPTWARLACRHRPEHGLRTCKRIAQLHRPICVPAMWSSSSTASASAARVNSRG